MDTVEKKSYQYRGRVYTCWTRLEAALVAEILKIVAESGHPRAEVVARLAQRLKVKVIAADDRLGLS